MEERLPESAPQGTNRLVLRRFQQTQAIDHLYTKKPPKFVVPREKNPSTPFAWMRVNWKRKKRQGLLQLRLKLADLRLQVRSSSYLFCELGLAIDSY